MRPCMLITINLLFTICSRSYSVYYMRRVRFRREYFHTCVGLCVFLSFHIGTISLCCWYVCISLLAYFLASFPETKSEASEAAIMFNPHLRRAEALKVMTVAEKWIPKCLKIRKTCIELAPIVDTNAVISLTRALPPKRKRHW